MKTDIQLTGRLFIDYGQAIEKVLRRAVNHAVLTHKRLGNPIATWKDGKVVIVSPEDIQVHQVDHDAVSLDQQS